ncbi:MAG: hypothetical protein AAGE76_07480 [Pseudomonadota bacterium]
MSGPLAHRTHARRTLALVLTAGGLMLAGAAVFVAPPIWSAWLMWVPLAAFLAMSLGLMAAEPVDGMMLGAEAWVFEGPGAPAPIALGDIDRVVIRSLTGGPDTVVVHLTDGRSVMPPPRCLPPAAPLRAALARAGLEVAPV